MLSARKEECALVNDIGDKLLELNNERADATSDGDLVRVHQLQAEIDDVKAERLKIITSAACSGLLKTTAGAVVHLSPGDRRRTILASDYGGRFLLAPHDHTSRALLERVPEM
jgi:hypothetical protein